MPRRKKGGISQVLFGKNLEDSYSGLILAAIIVVVLGLLVANYFSKRNSDFPQGQTSEIKSENMGGNQESEYKVEPNDSLSAISMKYYGSFDYWPVLARANNIKNPNLLYKDITLKIPAKDNAEMLRGELTTTSYEVQAGDTLFAISEKVYGDGYKWMVLDRANKVGRLPNGNPLIFAGNKLVIPR